MRCPPMHCPHVCPSQCGRLHSISLSSMPLAVQMPRQVHPAHLHNHLHATPCLCACSDRLTELRRAIKEAQEEALEPGHVFPAAFATFRNRTSQVGRVARGEGGGHCSFATMSHARQALGMVTHG